MSINAKTIKRSDILVAERLYADGYFKRDYIIFIASGNYNVPRDQVGCMAAIDLQGIFHIYEHGKAWISCEFVKRFRKPSFHEMLELNIEIKKQKYRFNKKTKKLRHECNRHN